PEPRCRGSGSKGLQLWPSLVVRRRGCAGDSARSATHSRADCCAGRAPDGKRYDTPNRCADTRTGSSARQGASAGIGVPMPVTIVVSAIIVRIGEPANMLIVLVSVVPVGVVVGDRCFFAVSIPLMHPPAFVVLIAGDIGSVDSSFGAGDRRHHRGCARNGDKRTQSEQSMKLSH